MSTGQNNCGFSEGPGTFTVQGAYRGDTGLFANIDSGLNCIPGHFPDGQNTVSWGSINSSLYNQTTHTGKLGTTCFENDGRGNMTEADIYLGSNVQMVDTLPANCTYQEDVQTLATHEWGHAFGLAHEMTQPDQVMYPTRPWCQVRRHLGGEDFNGMLSLY
jgi:hypothetical protein